MMSLRTAVDDEELVGRVLTASPDAMVFVLPNGVVEDCNAAAESVFGLSRTEIRGRSFSTLVAPEERGSADELVRARDSSEHVRRVVAAIRADESRLLAEVTSSPLGDGGGFTQQVRDVTEPGLIQAGGAAVSEAQDLTEALISLGSALRRVVPFERLALSVVEGADYRVAARIGPSGELANGELQPLETTALGEVVATSLPVTVADTHTSRFTKDERLANDGVEAYIVVPLVASGRVAGALTVGFRRPGVPPETVVELLTSLSSSISRPLLNALMLEEQAGAIRRLEELDRLKNQFLALVTHDIRTPLSVISGFAESLRSSWRELPDDARLESLDAILRNGKNLTRLVEEGLQVALIESGELSYRLAPFDLALEVETTVNDFAVGGDASRFRISIEDDLPPARGDQERHWQILTNILSNAVKFSAAPEAIDVAVRREGPMLKVAVSDRGRGIAPEQLPKLFQKFSRVGRAEEQRVRGAGLGLFISKALVEAQGGRVWVESTPGKGSTFAYTIPIATEIHAPLASTALRPVG